MTTADQIQALKGEARYQIQQITNDGNPLALVNFPTTQAVPAKPAGQRGYITRRLVALNQINVS